jgi:ankyrin repeat protein
VALLCCGCTQTGFRLTPLLSALEEGKLEVVRLLLERGADMEAKNMVRTPRATAATCCVGMCGGAKLAGCSRACAPSHATSHASAACWLR